MSLIKIKTRFLVIFAILLWLPLFQQYSQFFRIQPHNENRNRVQVPTDFKSLIMGRQDFPSRFEAYYNDNYGFRDFLIRLKNQLNYSLFEKSDQVIIGKSSFLFYRRVVENDEIQVERRIDQELPKLLGKLHKLATILKKQGAQLVILPMPLKNSIYPELLPRYAPHRPSPLAIQRFITELKNQPEILVLDTYSQMMSLKSQIPVFHKTDFHWNDVAGSEVGKAFVNLLGMELGLGQIWTHSVSVERNILSEGGQTVAMAIYKPIVEETLFARVPPTRHSGTFTSTPNQANTWRYTQPDLERIRLIPATVMFGDSFADAFLRVGFLRYFKSFQKYYIKELKENISHLQKDVKFVVMEFIETELVTLFEDDYWPKEVRSAPPVASKVIGKDP